MVKPKYAYVFCFDVKRASMSWKWNLITGNYNISELAICYMKWELAWPVARIIHYSTPGYEGTGNDMNKINK